MRSPALAHVFSVFFTVLFSIAAATSVSAQKPAVPVVGWLNPQTLSSSQHLYDGFRMGLREGGFMDGKNGKIELRPANGKRKQLPALAADRVRLGVSVIMAGSPPAALAAQRATKTVPIVFTSGADPMRLGLVSSYRRPGGNVTGFHVQFRHQSALLLRIATLPSNFRIVDFASLVAPSVDQSAGVKAATRCTAIGMSAAGRSGQFERCTQCLGMSQSGPKDS